jgi:hypothetical protein
MNGNLCTWKHQIIHPIRAVSINVYFFLLPRRRSELCLYESFGEWLLMADEICDDIHLNKQLNEAERFAFTYFRSLSMRWFV